MRALVAQRMTCDGPAWPGREPEEWRMTRLASERADVRVPGGSSVRLLESLATNRFCAAMLEEAGAWSRVDHCAIMRISDDGVRVFGAEHRQAFAARGAGAAIAYIDYYHRFDPNRRLLAN